MKTNRLPQSAPAFMPAKLFAVGCFQICRESRGGDFIPGFSTDSDTKIMEAYILQAFAHDGGDIRFSDHSEQRMVAFAQWKIARAELGLPVLHRANAFHDWSFAMIARDLLRQNKICGAVEMQF